MGHDSFDLVARKESSRAGVTAETKAHTLRVGRGVLHFARAFRIGLTELGKAEGVEFIGVRIDVGVHGDSLGRDADTGMSGNDKAIRHLVVDVDHTLHCYCA